MPAPGMQFTGNVISDLNLETVCESAKCPNRTECWSQKTATLMILGNVCTAGIGQAPARQAAIKAGIPGEVGSTTINKVCASGLKSVVFAAQAIQAEDADLIVAGGMESMSNVPHYLKTGRSGKKLGDQNLIDGIVYDGLWCAFENQHMGNIAEFTARNSKVSREEQDEFALKSHEKAVKAIQTCNFKAETIPVEVLS
ncbi:MAG: acetyl-CoA C-acyltransferase, partial [Planctomycetes bacterium]|nr:acetyl-CoA C-acyltransferase [Planctomycetota bacterium]